jgi:hypothetical protein
MVAPYLHDEVKHAFLGATPIALDVFDRSADPSTGVASAVYAADGSGELAAELDGAADFLGVQVEEILLAALGRTFGRTRGEGAVSVDVQGPSASRTVTLLCAASWPMGPSEMLQGAHNSLSANALSAPATDVVATAEIVLGVDTVGQVAGAALQVRAHRGADGLHLDWCYDPARLDDYSVQEMAEQFPLALIEITSDAGVPL